MFGIGMQELVVILLVALIFIGPKKLPEIAQALGKGFAEFRKATQDFKDTLDIDNDVSQVKSAFKDMQDEVKDAVSDAKKAPRIWEEPPAAGHEEEEPSHTGDVPSPQGKDHDKTEPGQKNQPESTPPEDTPES